VLTSGHQRRQPEPAANPERAHAFRSVELVRGEREQIDAERLDVDWDLSGRLDGVGVEHRAPSLDERGDLADGLHGAYLVVGVHDRDEGRVVRERRPYGLQAHDAALVDRHDRDPPRLLAEGLDGVQHGLVLDGRRDEMAAASDAERLGDAPNGQVVTFGAAAREDDLRWVGADERRDRVPGLVQDRFGQLPEVVHARGIPVLVSEHGGHPFDHLRCNRGRGVMVEVDAVHGLRGGACTRLFRPS
jgi:hypothetical protein